VFSSYDQSAFDTFGKKRFELYYPNAFQEEVNQILAIEDKPSRRERKTDLLKKVLEWTKINREAALAEWRTSASELIEFLHRIESKLVTA
jgi:hypothetical protein